MPPAAGISIALAFSDPPGRWIDEFNRSISETWVSPEDTPVSLPSYSVPWGPSRAPHMRDTMLRAWWSTCSVSPLAFNDVTIEPTAYVFVDALTCGKALMMLCIRDRLK